MRSAKVKKSLKFLGNDGSGWTDDAIAAFDYATMMRRDYGVNVRVTNNSWGGGGYSQALHDAIAEVGEAGILSIAAAGNDSSNNDAVPHYPSNYDVDSIVSVAATAHNDDLASFSSYGLTTVDLAAPGVAITSALPGDDYEAWNGTSMASPHVSAVAALLWSHFPNASLEEVRDAIFNGVDPLPSLRGRMVTEGRLNAFNAFKFMGLMIRQSSPARDSTVAAPPTDFVLSFADPYDPTAVDATDLEVNGNPADSFTITDAVTLTFHFDTSPVCTLHVAPEGLFLHGWCMNP